MEIGFGDIVRPSNSKIIEMIVVDIYKDKVVCACQTPDEKIVEIGFEISELVLVKKGNVKECHK